MMLCLSSGSLVGARRVGVRPANGLGSNEFNGLGFQIGAL
jgi:hypothetical protein